MSQKVNIVRVKVRGAAVYLGDDPTGSPAYSSDPDRVMRWLCDGWRGRFNQCRSTRARRDEEGRERPLGARVTDLTDSAARRAFPWLAALPTLVLQSASRIEATEWYAASKRWHTLANHGREPGRMPGFKARRAGLWFVCWHDGGRNANLRRVGRHRGIVTITGQNPPGRRDGGCRWSVEVHVRLSQPVRDYTNVNVNWSRRTCTFTNAPEPLAVGRTGRAVGVDMGCAHQMATSDGEFLDLPLPRLRAIEAEIARLRRSQARKAAAAGFATERAYRRSGRASGRYRRDAARIRRLWARRHAIVADATHKATTRLVRENDAIAVEDVRVSDLARRPRPRPDGHGGWGRNGRAAKAGRDRSLYRSAWGMAQGQLEYKAALAGRALVRVNAAYTSQTCPVCGTVDARSRESQAAFRCTSCGHADNADVNAARNILARGLALLRQGGGGTATARMGVGCDAHPVPAPEPRGDG